MTSTCVNCSLPAVPNEVRNYSLEQGYWWRSKTETMCLYIAKVCIENVVIFGLWWAHLIFHTRIHTFSLESTVQTMETTCLLYVQCRFWAKLNTLNESLSCHSQVTVLWLYHSSQVTHDSLTSQSRVFVKLPVSCTVSTHRDDF